MKTVFILCMTILLTGCVKPKERIVVDTQIIEKTIPTVARPRSVSLDDVKWYVVNRNNLEEFLERFSTANGQVVFAALSIKDYEKLSLNTEELRRYIRQQQQIIVYYEKSVSP